MIYPNIAETRTRIADFTDDEIVAALDRGDYCGGRAGHVIFRLNPSINERGINRRAMYRRLMLLENAGRIHRDHRLSARNSIFWWPGRDLADRSYEALRK
jgi:hypothetical protein